MYIKLSVTAGLKGEISAYFCLQLLPEQFPRSTLTLSILPSFLVTLVTIMVN